MCSQAIACVLTVVGLTLLLLCFLPTWLICVLGLLMLGTGIALLILWIKKGC